MLVTQDGRVAVQERFQSQGLLRVPSFDEPGLSFDPGYIHRGASSGYQAINLAVHLGARQIILLGFDMQPTGGESHWHGDHPKGLANPTADTFAAWRRRYATLPPDLETADVEVVNCSRETALTVFPRARLQQAL